MVRRENEMRHFSIMILIAFVTALTASPAHAYLDGGTGSMLVQLLLGGVAGITVLAKLYWRRLTDLLGFTAPDVAHSEAHTKRG